MNRLLILTDKIMEKETFSFLKNIIKEKIDKQIEDIKAKPSLAPVKS